MVEIQLNFGEHIYQVSPYRPETELSHLRKFTHQEMDEQDKEEKKDYITSTESCLFDGATLESMLQENCNRDTSKQELTSFLKFKDENHDLNSVHENKEYNRGDEDASSSSTDNVLSKKKLKRKNTLEESWDLGWLMNYSAAKLFKPSLQDMSNQNNIRTKESRVDPKFSKPGITYTEMIEKALIENGRLTVSEIYKWIQTKFPYFDKDDPRWKNSVRHNLSINPLFRKGEKSDKGGSGHYWRLNKEHDEKYSQWQMDKVVSKASCSNKKPDLLMDDKHDELEHGLDDEVERATKSILKYSDPLSFTTSPLPDVLNDFYMGPNVEVELIHSTPPTWDENSTDNFDPILNDSILFSDTANLTLQTFDLVTKM